MKKKTTTAETYETASVKLTREDLSEIFAIFKSNFQAVSIEDDEAEYDSLENLEESKGKFIQELRIIGSTPYLLRIRNKPSQQEKTSH